jgi:hypothetical protein
MDGYSKKPEKFDIRVAMFHNLANNVDYVLSDPHENPLETQKLYMSFFCDKSVLIAMYPDRENCKKILKDSGSTHTLYMGPMDIIETKQMWTSCYEASVSFVQLTQRFDQAGGVPRLLFKESVGPADSVLDEIYGLPTRRIE